MIKYCLKCKNCTLEFESWFSSSKEFDRLKKLKEVKNELKKYQKFVKDNFEFVGDNFAYEARSIHYNKKKEKKGIYGQASPQEVKELKNEGIETEFIPWINDKEN